MAALLTLQDSVRLQALLRLDEPVNIYPLGVLARSAQPGMLANDGRFFGLPQRGALGAMIYVSHSGLVVPYGPDAYLLSELAERLWGAAKAPLVPGLPQIRVVSGPRAAVATVRAALEPLQTLRLFRHMRLYSITPPALRIPPDPAVELACPGDEGAVGQLVGSMHGEEFGRDPSVFDTPGFHSRIRTLIREERVFLRRVEGEIAFHTSANAVSEFGAQIEAVYTAPRFRRTGVATGALAGVCARLLKGLPCVVLSVAEDNVPATRLYERLGFTPGAALALLAT